MHKMAAANLANMDTPLPTILNVFETIMKLLTAALLIIQMDLAHSVVEDSSTPILTVFVIKSMDALKNQVILVLPVELDLHFKMVFVLLISLIANNTLLLENVLHVEMAMLLSIHTVLHILKFQIVSKAISMAALAAQTGTILHSAVFVHLLHLDV